MKKMAFSYCRGFAPAVRDALHNLLNDLGKEHVRELLQEVLIDLYSKTKEKRKE